MAAGPEAIWLWNRDPAPDLVQRQLEGARARGLRSLALWPWAGLETPLWTDEHVAHLASACDAAATAGMTLWLADDLHWPSGTAGGALLREVPAYAQRALVCATRWTASDAVQTITWRGEGERLVLALALDDAGARRDLSAQLEAKGRATRQWRASSHDGYRARWESEVWEAELTLPPGDWFVNVAMLVRLQPLLPATVGCAWSPQVPGTLDVLNPAAVESYVRMALEPLARAAGAHAGGAVAGIVSVPPPLIGQHALVHADDWRTDVLPWLPDFPEVFERLFDRQAATHLPYALAPLHEGQPSAPLEQLHAYAEAERARLFETEVSEWCAARRLERRLLSEDDLRQLPALPLTLRGERKRAVSAARVVGLDPPDPDLPASTPLSGVASLTALRLPAARSGSGWEPLEVFDEEWEWQPHSWNALPLGDWPDWSHVSRARDGTVRFDVRVTFEAAHVPEDVALLFEEGVVEGVALNGTPVPLGGAHAPQPGEIEHADACHRLVRLHPRMLQVGVNTVSATAVVRPADRALFAGGAAGGPLALAGSFALQPAPAGGTMPDGRPGRWCLVRAPARVSPGSWTAAGYPRFAGSATYAQTVHLPRTSDGAALRLTVDGFGKPVALRVEGRAVERGSASPYVFDLAGVVHPGLNRLAITCWSDLGPRLHPGLEAGLASVRLEVRE